MESVHAEAMGGGGERQRSHRVLGQLISVLALDGFFFQAEDGIRDYKVTGVQTCALPIYVPPGTYDLIVEAPGFAAASATITVRRGARTTRDVTLRIATFVEQIDVAQIGRASCRERV